MIKRAWLGVLAVIVAAVATSAMAMPAPQTKILSLDLAKPFRTRSPWTLTATQGPKIPGPTGGMPGDMVDGVITFCLNRDAGRTCDPIFTDVYTKPDGGDDFDGPYLPPHGLQRAAVLRLPGTPGRPLLLVTTASVLSIDGSARVVTQVLLYNAAADRFTLAYQHVTGRNHNEDLRYMTHGPLGGTIITAELTQNAPYCFWIEVDRLGKGDRFEQVYRYRSATHYGDGNPLSPIDSEMPNLEQRMRLWHPGQALPLPPVPCAKPHLVKQEMWCQ